MHHPAALIAILASFLVPLQTHADDWPQWGGPERDLVWREEGILESLPAEGETLPRVWSTPIGQGYAGPAVAEGRVFVMDRPDNRSERVLCLDAADGRVLWQHKYRATYSISYPIGPRCTPAVDAGRLYAVGAMGDLFCLDVETGRVIWQKNFVKDYGTTLPTWGMVHAPLIDGEQCITLVGGKNALVVSFDKTTGKELWRALDDPQVGYNPAMIFEFGGKRQLIMWHPDAVSALNPQNGKVLWQVPYAVHSGLTVPTPRKVGEDRLFVTSFYNGPRMIEVAADGSSARIVWRGESDSEVRTDGIHSIISTPLVKDGHIYGIDSYGALKCLDADTGDELWSTYDATGRARWWNAFLILHAPSGRVFIHNDQGELIIAHLTPDGYEELSRAVLVEPTQPIGRRMTIWSHPAFAMQSVFARNDKEIVRVDLSK